MGIPKPNKIIAFITQDLWRIQVSDLPRIKALLIKLVRIVVLSVKGLVEDQGHLRAAALTLYSLLGIVPVVAMIFGIAKGFGFERNLQAQLLAQLEGHEEVAGRIIDFAHSMLETTQGGLVAGIGLLILFWTIIKVLSNIEASFNSIWGIKTGRPLGRKISDYLSLMLICPLLFVFASASSVLVVGQVEALAERIHLLGHLSPVLFSLMRLLPLLAIWILFSFLYAFMPNTRVKLSSAMVGGLIGAVLYTLLQWGYIHFQVSVSKYNAIYGSFAALPLFLVWLQLSWLMVLFGAEVSFAHQNVGEYEFDTDCRNMPITYRKTLALAVLHLLVKDFARDVPPWDQSRLAYRLKVPPRCVREVLNDLTAAGVVAEQRFDDGRPETYQPARAPEVLTIRYVTKRLEELGNSDIPIPDNPETRKIAAALSHLEELEESSEANICLKDI